MTFKEFLIEKFLEEEPQTLDNLIPDSFNDWLDNIDIEDVIDYADKYANKIIIQIKKELIRK